MVEAYVFPNLHDSADSIMRSRSEGRGCSHVVCMEMGKPQVIDSLGMWKSFGKFKDIPCNPLTGPTAVIRQSRSLESASGHISGIDQHSRTIRHYDERSISLSCRYGMDVHPSLLPLRKRFCIIYRIMSLCSCAKYAQEHGT